MLRYFKRRLEKIFASLTRDMTEVKFISCRDALSVAYPDRVWAEDDLTALNSRWDRYAEHYWSTRNGNQTMRSGLNGETLVRVAEGLSEIVRIVRDWRVEEQVQAIRRLQLRLKELDVDGDEDTAY